MLRSAWAWRMKDLSSEQGDGTIEKIPEHFSIVLICLFKVSLCNLILPQTHHVAHAGVEFTAGLVALLPQGWGMRHHTRVEHF